MFDDDFLKHYDDIKNNLIKKNFKIFHEIKKKENGKIDFFKGFDHKSTLFEILSWSLNKKKNVYQRWKINLPRKFLDNYYSIKFLKKNFRCPGPIEEYLEYQYGNWKIPKNSLNKEEYLSKKFFTRDNIFKKLILKILKR